MCLSAFPPTKDFEAFLIKYLLSNYNGSGVARIYAPWCYWRLQLTLNHGADDPPLSMEAAADMEKHGVKAHQVMFGGLLEYIVSLEKMQGSTLNIPLILPWLCKCVEDCGGFKTKGIFRIAAEKSEIEALRKSIEEGKMEWKRNDPHVPADVLKHFLRDLCDPVIPLSMYNEALAVSDSAASCAQFAKKLPKVHYDTLDFMITWLNGLVKHQAVTAMGDENIAIVFAMDLLRSTETDPTQAFKNSAKEKNFVCNLLIAWRQGLHLK
jgi:hypothetical protein